MKEKQKGVPLASDISLALKILCRTMVMAEAPNYMGWSMIMKGATEGGKDARMDVIVQRVEGKSPSLMHAEAVAEIEKLKEEIRLLKAESAPKGGAA